MSGSNAGASAGFKALASMAVAITAVAVAARVDVPVPGSPIPQSLQTLAVVLVGAWLGPRLGAGALALYPLLGGLGLPVFADGAGGGAHLTGPTAGYLAGFVLAAALVGWWCKSGPRDSMGGVLVAALAAHALILGLGWARLAFLVGAGEALRQGVSPFLVGGLAKSVVATAVIAVARRFGGRPLGTRMAEAQ